MKASPPALSDGAPDHVGSAIRRLDGEEEGDWLESFDAIDDDDGRREVAEAAARFGEAAALRAMLARGIEIDEPGGIGSTLLELAAGMGGSEAVECLLEAGADPTLGLPLVRAAFAGHLESVRLLLEAGANPDGANPGFPTALGTARAKGNKEIEALLLQYGASREVGGAASEVVLRHRPASASGNPDSSHLPALRASLDSIFGGGGREERFGGELPIELAAVPPSTSAPWWTVFTLGMSALETTSRHAPEPRLTELSLRLPADWDIEQALSSSGASQWRWPIEQLVHLARLPHEYRTSLVPGDTVPNGDPPEPFDQTTALSGWLLLPDTIATNEALVLDLGATRVHVLACYALHASETKVKLEQGLDTLMRELAAANLTPALDPRRPPVV
ncbi:MAG: suppressor of fused domain protein [Deltaproteobacteria bacterium]|nr:suppressor of fused domain protein [Deltaproteobacteria bacterium]